MADKGFGLIDKLAHRRNLRRWGRVAQGADHVAVEELRPIRGAARRLRSELDQVLHKVEARLAQANAGAIHGVSTHDADWTWRPELWRGPLDTPGQSDVASRTRIGSEVAIFHDCALSELTFRQIRNQREAYCAPYALSLEVFDFEGSFLSVAVDLPQEAMHGLSKTHLVTLTATFEVEQPLEIFARLNIKHGPNTEQIVREFPGDPSDGLVEFDLAYSGLNEKRIERGWVDLIFESPRMNQITMRDVTFARRPRAAF